MSSHRFFGGFYWEPVSTTSSPREALYGFWSSLEVFPEDVTCEGSSSGAGTLLLASESRRDSGEDGTKREMGLVDPVAETELSIVVGSEDLQAAIIRKRTRMMT